MSYRILAIRSDPALERLLSACAQTGGYELRVVPTASQGLEVLLHRRPDLVVVELRLPDLDGLAWLQIIRQTKEGRGLPVIVASRRSSEEGMIQAFDLAADDYIAFGGCDEGEVSARIRAVLRRRYDVEELRSDVMERGPVALDPGRHVCRVRGKSVELRPREFELLEILMRKAGRVLNRAYLLEGAWGMSRTADTRAVDVTVSRLRRALGRRAGLRIETVARFGYRFRT